MNKHTASLIAYLHKLMFLNPKQTFRLYSCFLCYSGISVEKDINAVGLSGKALNKCKALVCVNCGRVTKIIK